MLPSLTPPTEYCCRLPLLTWTLALLAFAHGLKAKTDLEAPFATILTADPLIVDVTNGDAISMVELRVSDDVTGLSSGSILVQLENLSWKWYFDNNNLVEGQSTNGIYRVPITFVQGAPPGARPIGAIAFDGAGRSRSGYSESVVITVINNGIIDQEPPTIHSLNLTPRILDLTDGPGSVSLEMEVSDDATGIMRIFGDLEPPIENFSPDTRKWVWSRVTTGNERKVLTTTYPLGAWSPAGEWRLEFEEFVDEVGRGSKYGFGAPELYEDFEATVTVVNPNQDLVSPVLESLSFDSTTADTTFGEVLLPYTVEISDARSGVDFISVRLHPPSGGREITSYKRSSDGITTGTINEGTLTANFKVPAFIESGNWPVSVRLGDLAGHVIIYGYGSDNPLPPGSPATITVENAAGVDQEDMQIAGLTISPNPVDVTDSLAFLEVRLSFTDNLSGFERASIRIDSPDGEFREYVSFDIDDFLFGTLTSGTVGKRFQIPRFSEPGQWKIESFSMTDKAGNYYSVNSYPVFIDDLPNSIEVINNGPRDLEAPTLISFTLPQTSVDVTSGQQFVPIRAVASDDLSGIDRVVIYFRHSETRDRQGFFPGKYDVIFRDANTVTMEDTGLFRELTPPGDYLLDEVTLYDFAGRRTQYRANSTTNPLPNGLPEKVTVLNSGPADFEDPAFTGIRLSTDSVDITNAPAFITAEIDFIDDQSGLEDIDIQIYHEGTSPFPTVFDSWLDNDLFEIVSGDTTNGTARLIFEIPQFLPAGVYEVKYELRDTYRRDLAIAGDIKNVDAFPYTGAGFITILNEGPVDRQDPIITEISLPESVDVTDLAQEVNGSISFLDDVAGIKKLSLSLSGPERDFARVELLSENLTSGTLTDGTINFILTIPAFAESGEWTISSTMEDAVSNLEFLDPDELQSLGLQHTFTVENRQPAGYLWKGSKACPDDWREVDWFGWVQDKQTFPYVYHLEHGWIYTDGSNLARFFFYDVALDLWWWVDWELYPYVYASGRHNGWFYYYAPYGSPGNRWFHDLGRGVDVPESEL